MRDFKTLGIDLTLQAIEEMPKKRYRKLIQGNIKDCALKYLIDKKEKRNRAQTSAHTSAHASLRAHTSTQTSAHTSFGARASTSHHK